MVYGDVFQCLVTLANIDNKPEKAAPALLRLISELQRLATSTDCTVRRFLEEGKNEYLRHLGERGRHHLDRVIAYGDRIASLPFAPVTASLERQQLRDYWHDAYYAAFYLARYAMIENGHYDCTDHKQAPAVLEQLEKKYARDNESLSLRFQQAKQLLKELRQPRGTADYVMSMASLEELTNKDRITTLASRLRDLFAEWGVP